MSRGGRRQPDSPQLAYSVKHKRPRYDICLSSSQQSMVLSVRQTATSVSENLSEQNIQNDENHLENSIPETNGGKLTKRDNFRKLICGTYIILHVIENEDDPTFIVQNEAKEFAICRQISPNKYRHYVTIHQRLSYFCDTNDECSDVQEQIWPRNMELFISDQDKKCYVVTPRHYGSLHSYVIDKKKLTESETRFYYLQILKIVSYCHQRGVVVRDVKLRNFVFVDEHRRRIRLDVLDELLVCQSVEDDSMSDRYGCPAYVSPEMLDLSKKYYAGKKADVWSLGVLLYVMLMGKYPFYDKTAKGLFDKIRTASFLMNEQCNVSRELRWLVRCLLRQLPEERPNVHELLTYPWLKTVAIQSSIKQEDLREETDLPAVLPFDNVTPPVQVSENDQQVPF